MLISSKLYIIKHVSESILHSQWYEDPQFEGRSGKLKNGSTCLKKTLPSSGNYFKS